MPYSRNASAKDGLKSKLAALLPFLWGMVGLVSVTLGLVSGNYNITLLITLVISLGFFIGAIGVVMEKKWGFIILMILLAIDFSIGVLSFSIARPLIDLAIIGAVSRAYMGYSVVA